MKKSHTLIGIIVLVTIGVSSIFYELYLIPPPQVAVALVPNPGPYISNYGSNPIQPTVGNANNVIVLRWQLPMLIGTNMTGFQIYRGTASGYETLIGTTTINQLAFLDPQVTPGQVYYYYITALLTNGNNAIISPEIRVQN